MPSGPGPVFWLFVGPCSLLEAKGWHSGTDTVQGDVLTAVCRNWPGPAPALPGGGGQTLTGARGSLFMVHTIRWSLGQGGEL